MTKKLVVISAIHYPLTMARYFWNAFERRDDIILKVVGPFSGTYIPWNNGIHLNPKHVKTPDFPLPISSVNQRVPASMLDIQIGTEADLWLDIDAGWCVDGRPKAKVYAQIQTDPHVFKGRYNSVKTKYDKIFCMQNCYREQDEIYLPYAYDPTIHYPEYETKKEYDVCMIGLAYQQREEVAKRLILDGRIVRFGIGMVYDEYRREYNKSKVAVSWSSLKDTPARVWEAMAMKIPLVCNRTPDLDLFFIEGVHYLGFIATNDAVNRVQTYLDTPDLAKKIADSAYEFVTHGHSWDDRCEFIMKECGLL